MSVMTQQVSEIDTLPRVNLLPPEIAAAARFRRLQLAMGAVVVLAVVVVGGLWAHSRTAVTAAQTRVAAAQSQQTALNARLAGLQTVKQTYADLQSKQASLTEAMGGEIRWSFLLNDMSMILPRDIWLTSMSASETDAASPVVSSAPTGSAASSGSTSSASSASVGPYGSVQFQGDGLTHDDVAALLLALSHEKGFVAPTFSSSQGSSTGAGSTVTFSSEVGLTAAELSNRYTDGTAN